MRIQQETKIELGVNFKYAMKEKGQVCWSGNMLSSGVRKISGLELSKI